MSDRLSETLNKALKEHPTRQLSVSTFRGLGLADLSYETVQTFLLSKVLSGVLDVRIELHCHIHGKTSTYLHTCSRSFQESFLKYRCRCNVNWEDYFEDEDEDHEVSFVFIPNHPPSPDHVIARVLNGEPVDPEADPDDRSTWKSPFQYMFDILPADEDVSAEISKILHEEYGLSTIPLEEGEFDIVDLPKPKKRRVVPKKKRK